MKTYSSASFSSASPAVHVHAARSSAARPHGYPATCSGYGGDADVDPAYTASAAAQPQSPRGYHTQHRTHRSHIGLRASARTAAAEHVYDAQYSSASFSSAPPAELVKAYSSASLQIASLAQPRRVKAYISASLQLVIAGRASESIQLCLCLSSDSITGRAMASESIQLCQSAASP